LFVSTANGFCGLSKLVVLHAAMQMKEAQERNLGWMFPATVCLIKLFFCTSIKYCMFGCCHHPLLDYSWPDQKEEMGLCLMLLYAVGLLIVGTRFRVQFAPL
jgi:hypothetical protein